MNCPACGHENPGDAAFCGECAASLAPEIQCPSCRRRNPAGQKFCHGCAGPLTAAPSERDPRAYTPKHLADKILQSKSALEGERKQVTVLFADVKGSMDLQARTDSNGSLARSIASGRISGFFRSTASLLTFRYLGVGSFKRARARL